MTLTCINNEFTVQINEKYRVGVFCEHFWATTQKNNSFDSLNWFADRADSLKESDFPHLVDGGGGRGGTSWTKRGFKRVYDFRVEPSHSVSQWTRAHCDNRSHCVRFRLGSKRDSVQKIAQNKGVSIWKTFIVKKGQDTRKRARSSLGTMMLIEVLVLWARRADLLETHWCVTYSCYHSLSDQSVQCGFVARSPNHSKRGISIIPVSGSKIHNDELPIERPGFGVSVRDLSAVPARYAHPGNGTHTGARSSAD